jgi:hypothetical protein
MRSRVGVAPELCKDMRKLDAAGRAELSTSALPTDRSVDSPDVHLRGQSGQTAGTYAAKPRCCDSCT